MVFEFKCGAFCKENVEKSVKEAITARQSNWNIPENNPMFLKHISHALIILTL